MATSVQESHVLVVGAGGIGCELLKNLVLTGYNNIVVIDLDTIDLSNLNRQFLFRRHHISQPKALVARATALKFKKNVNIKAYHDNIMNSNYGITFFKQFDCVINGLDNRKARSHVNRMCLASDVPLIETGTAGYFGQVEMIVRGLTQCYDCEPKAAQKTFPGCTIRNTPSEPIHCIVWAKHLFNQLFGEEDAENEVSPDSADPEARKENEHEIVLEDTKIVGDGNVQRISTRAWAKEINYDAEKLYNKFFVDDINYLLSMKNLWTTRKSPTPLNFNWEQINTYRSGNKFEGINRTMKVWPIEICRQVFKSSVEYICERYYKLPESDFLTWDKDDSDMLDFVTACACLRCYAFSIEVKSRFEIKAMAGNIIPAIAMTNAVIAGLAVKFANRILANKAVLNRTIYLRREANHRGDRLTREKRLIVPNPKCYVCSSNPKMTIYLDTTHMKVKEFEEKILKNHLNMVQPDAYVGASLIISSEAGETEHNEKKTLSEVNVVDGTIVAADDFFQDYRLSIIVCQMKKTDDERDFIVEGDVSEIKSLETSEPVPGPSGVGQKRKIPIDVPGISPKKFRSDTDDLSEESPESKNRLLIQAIDISIDSTETSQLKQTNLISSLADEDDDDEDIMIVDDLQINRSTDSLDDAVCSSTDDLSIRVTEEKNEIDMSEIYESPIIDTNEITHDIEYYCDPVNYEKFSITHKLNYSNRDGCIIN